MWPYFVCTLKTEEQFCLNGEDLGEAFYICKTKIIKPLKLSHRAFSQIAFITQQVYFNECLTVNSNNDRTTTTVFCVILYFMVLREKKDMKITLQETWWIYTRRMKLQNLKHMGLLNSLFLTHSTLRKLPQLQSKIDHFRKSKPQPSPEGPIWVVVTILLPVILNFLGNITSLIYCKVWWICETTLEMLVNKIDM